MANNKYNNNVTTEDCEFIKSNYQNMTVKELAEKLNKKPVTIYKTIKKLNLQYENRDGKIWTQKEIDYLSKNYETMTYTEIGYELKRTPKSVMGKAHYLGLIKSNNSKNWTEEELTYLKENINSKSYDEISKHIHRSISAIYTKVWELQLVPKELKCCRKLKKEQAEFIIANCHKMTDAQLAKRFEVSIEAISALRKKYGIKKNGNETSGPTYIEQFIIDFLEDNKIKYKYNKQLGDYIPDFQINKTKVLIEAQGDYYHCNPYVYPDGPKDEIQIKHVLRDYYKKCYYVSRGYEIIEVWEKDINENPDEIKEYLKTKLAV